MACNYCIKANIIYYKDSDSLCLAAHVLIRFLFTCHHYRLKFVSIRNNTLFVTQNKRHVSHNVLVLFISN